MTDPKEREDQIRKRYEKEQARVERMHDLAEVVQPDNRAHLGDLEIRARKLEERIETAVGKAGAIYEEQYLRRGLRKERPLEGVPHGELKNLDRALSKIRHDMLELTLGSLRRIAQTLALTAGTPPALDYLRSAADNLEGVRREVRDFFDTELPDGTSLRRRFLSTATEVDDLFRELTRLTRKLSDPSRAADLAKDTQNLDQTVEAILTTFKGIRSDFDAAKVDVAAIARQVCEWSGEACREKGIQIRARIPRDQQFWAFFDPVSVRRIVNEGVHNATKYAFPADFVGSRSIEVTLSRSSKEIGIEIVDNGQGIAPGLLENLGRVPQTTGKDSHGGQGCCILRELTESLGGQVEWHSQPGKGTKLQFRLAV